MFITDQCNVEVSIGYFCACIEEMDLYNVQTWPILLALDFVRAFGAH